MREHAYKTGTYTTTETTWPERKNWEKLEKTERPAERQSPISVPAGCESHGAPGLTRP